MSKKVISRRSFLQTAGMVGAASVLAACAPQAPTAAPAATAAPKKEEPTAAPVQAEVVQIECLGDPGDPTKYEEEMKRFEEMNPGVKWVQVQQAEGTSRLEQLMTLVAAGTPPDVSRVESDVYRTFCKDKLLMDITDRITVDPELSKKDFWIQPQESDRCVYEGKWYGIGSCWVAPHFYYNVELFDELGIEPPSNDPDQAWTWDHFIEVAKQITIDNNGKHPDDAGFDAQNIKRFGAHWPTWWIPLHAAVQSNGIDWVDPKTGTIMLDTPEAMEALQRVADLQFVHHVAPSAATLTATGMGESQFMETKLVGLYNTGSWALNWLWQIKGKIGTGVLPKMARPGTDMQAHIMTVVRETKKPDAAWKLVRYFSDPWYQERYCKSGLWIPSQTQLLQPSAIANWCTEPEHPKGYDMIVTKYTKNYGHYLTMPVGYTKASETVLQPAFDKLFNGEAKAADVLPEAVKQANQIMQEEQSRGS